eukprot:scaffold1228_cov246-Pinguiococcus_pyrenoidosus.AAC.21
MKQASTPTTQGAAGIDIAGGDGSRRQSAAWRMGEVSSGLAGALCVRPRASNACVEPPTSKPKRATG